MTKKISIHAPHEGERPKNPSSCRIPNKYFNPRSPRGGATRTNFLQKQANLPFQSTLPTRGSDSPVLPAACCSTHFNPRSPRGGATGAGYRKQQGEQISIHAPHEGERHGSGDMYYAFIRFQSTLPTRGSDALAYILFRPLQFFNPRSPRGGATNIQTIHSKFFIFQSTLPTRGSDLKRFEEINVKFFSIHAPHEGERLRHDI